MRVETSIPKWGALSIFLSITLLSLALLFLFDRLLLKNRRGMDVQKRAKVSNPKSVQYKVKVIKSVCEVIKLVK